MIAAIGVARIREHNVRLTDAIVEMALERKLRVNSPLKAENRTGWIGIDFENSERACRELVEQRVFVDYRPGCGIRIGPHFYTGDEEIGAFFRILDRIR
jgi:kynureninase